MSTTTEAIALVDSLVKEKISKKTATQLVNFVEEHQTQSLKKDIEKIDLKINLVLGIIGVLVAVMIYLHSDTKADMKEVKAEIKEMKAKMEEVKTETKEMKKDITEIKRLLQKR